MNKRNRSSNGLLAAFFLLFSVIHLQHLALQTGFLDEYPYIDPVSGILLCAAFPVFYFYVLSLTGSFRWKNHRNIKHLIMVVPAILNLLYLMLFKSKEEISAYYYEEENRFTVTNALLLGGMVLLLLLYVLKSLQAIKSYSKRLEENFSSTEQIRLDWLNHLILFLLFLALFLGPLLIVIGLPEWNRIGMGIYTSSIYLSLMLKTLNQPLVHMEEVQRKSGFKLDEEKKTGYQIRLLKCMEELKPYLNPELSLKQLSELTGISVNDLSGLINEKYNYSFFDFVNSFRVKEFKQLISDPQKTHLKLEALGEESGFGSKTAFNRSFKKLTGKTPTEFRNSHHPVN
ncbi:helix-turn-helix domain-containing protein [Sporocytophaga myxococcoides]|uniref:helix-turn-helix domain-containing protein n=1 Tax=Sporocytophaga myxococcoides TaxID=153721 RepID=UPI0012E0C1E1|nr:helix-turn-helix domain-containing protein [Sporocytophaga myxococcoides]